MATEFKFDAGHLNNLVRSGLAAYVQRPPPDRIGWVLAQQMWLKDWRPKRSVFQVEHIEVTFDSLEGTRSYAESKLEHDFDPEEHLMFTRHHRFMTDNVGEIETFFSAFTDKPEYVRTPNSVGCPHRGANGSYDPCPYPIWNGHERSLVQVLLQAQRERRVIAWDDWTQHIMGRLGEIQWRHAELITRNGVETIWFESGKMVKYARGQNPIRWMSGEDRASNLGTLPIWNYSEQRWIDFGDETDG